MAVAARSNTSRWDASTEPGQAQLGLASTEPGQAQLGLECRPTGSAANLDVTATLLTRPAVTSSWSRSRRNPSSAPLSRSSCEWALEDLSSRRRERERLDVGGITAVAGLHRQLRDPGQGQRPGPDLGHTRHSRNRDLVLRSVPRVLARRPEEFLLPREVGEAGGTLCSDPHCVRRGHRA
jgi:hypothetical protein